MPTETRCVRIKLKEGAQAAVREWQDFMNRHRDDVLETLRQEGVALESVFIESVGADTFLIYVMRCADFDRAHDVARKSANHVDQFHKQFKKDWWEQGERLECLIDFSNDRAQKPQREDSNPDLRKQL